MNHPSDEYGQSRQPNQFNSNTRQEVTAETQQILELQNYLQYGNCRCGFNVKKSTIPQSHTEQTRNRRNMSSSKDRCRCNKTHRFETVRMQFQNAQTNYHNICKQIRKKDGLHHNKHASHRSIAETVENWLNISLNIRNDIKMGTGLIEMDDMLCMNNHSFPMAPTDSAPLCKSFSALEVDILSTSVLKPGGFKVGKFMDKVVRNVRTGYNSIIHSTSNLQQNTNQTAFHSNSHSDLRMNKPIDHSNQLVQQYSQSSLSSQPMQQLRGSQEFTGYRSGSLNGSMNDLNNHQNMQNPNVFVQNAGQVDNSNIYNIDEGVATYFQTFKKICSDLDIEVLELDSFFNDSTGFYHMNGKGLRLTFDTKKTDIYLENRSDQPIFIQSSYLDLLVKNKQNVDLPDSLPSIYAYECAPKEIVQIVNSEFFTTYYHQLEEIISQYDKNELPGSNPAFISSNNSTRMYSNHPNITSYADTNTSPTSISRDYLYYLIDDFVSKATNVFISLDENGFGRDAGHRSRTVRENSCDETRVWLRLNFDLFEESVDKLKNKLKNSSSCKTVQQDNIDSLFCSSRSR